MNTWKIYIFSFSGSHLQSKDPLNSIYYLQWKFCLALLPPRSSRVCQGDGSVNIRMGCHDSRILDHLKLPKLVFQHFHQLKDFQLKLMLSHEAFGPIFTSDQPLSGLRHYWGGGFCVTSSFSWSLFLAKYNLCMWPHTLQVIQVDQLRNN